jgi:hypothetical protein
MRAWRASRASDGDNEEDALAGAESPVAWDERVAEAHRLITVAMDAAMAGAFADALRSLDDLTPRVLGDEKGNLLRSFEGRIEAEPPDGSSHDDRYLVLTLLSSLMWWCWENAKARAAGPDTELAFLDRIVALREADARTSPDQSIWARRIELSRGQVLWRLGREGEADLVFGRLARMPTVDPAPEAVAISLEAEFQNGRHLYDAHKWADAATELHACKARWIGHVGPSLGSRRLLADVMWMACNAAWLDSREQIDGPEDGARQELGEVIAWLRQQPERECRHIEAKRLVTR